MEFYYSKKNKKMAATVSDPLFYDLVHFLSKKENDQIILRELKTQFPQKHFDALLEQSIQLKLIKRVNRRYTLGFSILDGYCLTNEMAAEAQLVLSEIAGYNESWQISFLSQLWDEWFAAANYFIVSNQSINFYEKRVVGNTFLKLGHFSLKNMYQNNLVDYFFLLANGDDLPIVLEDVETILGDVNPLYFFDQIQLIFERIIHHESPKIKKSIFSEILIQTGISDQSLNQLLIPEIFDRAVPDLSSLSTISFSKEGSVSVVEKATLFSYLLQGLFRDSVTFYTFNKG